MTTNTFAYNGFGARVSKTDSAGTTTYLRSGTSVVAPVVADSQAVYTPGISERRGSASRFYHGDIKNFVEQTDSSGQIVSSQQYDAFGNPVSSTGSWSGPFQYGGRFGYQSDSDTSLSLLGHRYYDSATGRFLTRDPIGDGRNWYGYCGNNPVRFGDPTGLWVVIVIGGVLAVAGTIALINELNRIGEKNRQIRDRFEDEADGADPDEFSEAYERMWRAKMRLVPEVEQVIVDEYRGRYVEGLLLDWFLPIFDGPDLPLSNPAGEAKSSAPLPQGSPVYNID
ncbi:MAG: hypothetical protein KatS3mg015_2178 [Fimbriimonadales bacterium]|nr:MAG: hypothetical protein KatS3mg015_2178 [Fimbriimonadales bacterium]